MLANSKVGRGDILRNTNKKGFTLIELLAVIVILAIIALIATPIVLKVIEDARKGAAVDSVYGYIDAIETNNVLATINPDKYTKIESTDDITKLNINLKGTKPTEGNIVVEKGRIKSAELTMSGYVCTYNGGKVYCGEKTNSSNIKIDIVNKKTNEALENLELKFGEQFELKAITDDGKEYVIEWLSSDENIATVDSNGVVSALKSGNVTITAKYKKFSSKINLVIIKETIKSGTVAFLDPTTGKKCDNYTSENSLNKTKTGCLKWYVIEEKNNKVNLLLDHNITDGTYWNSSGNTSIKFEESELYLDLQKAVTGWTETKDSARLITAKEIYDVTDINKGTTFDGTTFTGANVYANKSIYFDSRINSSGNLEYKMPSKTDKSNYAWLYNNTINCLNNGCEVEDSNAQEGYWTSTASVIKTSYGYGYVVDNDGRLYSYTAWNYPFGIRPVISVSSSELE